MARKRRRATFTLLLLIALAAALGARWVGAQLGPVRPGAVDPVVVDIPPGVSTREVADLLARNGVIKDATLFRYYARYKRLDAEIKGGQYQLDRSMTMGQVLQKLSRGDVIVHRFTIPEGFTVEQIADLLASKQLVDKHTFLQAAAASKLNAQYLPAGGTLAQPLEGYLFPFTYDYQPGVTAEQILSMMYAQWEKTLTPDLRARAKELGLSVHEAITLASIIEKEAQVAGERPTISGVYWNRLHIGMKLDADPAVAYALHLAPGRQLQPADLAVDSPYNTYTHAGLPPGPIAAPGLPSIKAALYPEKNDYWYFVAKEDGTGTHYFAKTLAEQTANIDKAAKNAKK